VLFPVPIGSNISLSVVRAFQTADVLVSAEGWEIVSVDNRLSLYRFANSRQICHTLQIAIGLVWRDIQLYWYCQEIRKLNWFCNLVKWGTFSLTHYISAFSLPWSALEDNNYSRQGIIWLFIIVNPLTTVVLYSRQKIIVYSVSYCIA
jgi:hypothetical protein